MAENDTESSALITNHAFDPRGGNSWDLCSVCGIGLAGHSALSDKVVPEEPSDAYSFQRGLHLNKPVVEDKEECDSERLYAAVEDTHRGVKYDKDKTRWDVVPLKALEEVAEVMTYGAEKYATHNWRKGMKWSRLFSAAIRHLTAFWLGEDNDAETGKSHLAHAVCCLLMLRDSHAIGVGEDDRDTR